MGAFVMVVVLALLAAGPCVRAFLTEYGGAWGRVLGEAHAGSAIERRRSRCVRLRSYAGARVTPEEEAAVEQHFAIGFRELYVRDIEHANAGDVRMGTFVLCAAFLDALSLTYSAGTKTKGGLAGKWSVFVARYFGPEYDFLRSAYDGFRSKLLHNYSARGIVFTHGARQAHLHLMRETGGPAVWLHRESFVRDVLAAYDAFEADVRSDAELRRRVLAHFNVFPPMAVQEFDVPMPPDDHA